MRIYLPLVEREVESRTPDAKANGEMRGTGTVLIAEDEQALRELVAARMRAEGYEVLEAENGEEALAIAGRYKGDIQLLLTDVIMPKLRGPELASSLRLRYPGMKVIYMSGYTVSGLAQDGMLERNTVLLQKTIHGEEDSGSDSTNECERPQLGSYSFSACQTSRLAISLRRFAVAQND